MCVFKLLSLLFSQERCQAAEVAARELEVRMSYHIVGNFRGRISSWFSIFMERFIAQCHLN